MTKKYLYSIITGTLMIVLVIVLAVVVIQANRVISVIKFHASCMGAGYVSYDGEQYYYYNGGGIYKYDGINDIRVIDADYYINDIAVSEDEINIAYCDRIECINKSTLEKNIIANTYGYLLETSNHILFAQQSKNDYTETYDEYLCKYDIYESGMSGNNINALFTQEDHYGLSKICNDNFTFYKFSTNVTNNIIGIEDAEDNILFRCGKNEYLLNQSEVLYTKDEGRALYYFFSGESCQIASIPDNYMVNINNLYCENGYVYVLLQDNIETSQYINYNIKQKLHNKDAIARINIYDDTCELLYETSSKRERIVAFNGNDIILLRKCNLIKKNMASGKEIILTHLNSNKDYIFEMCGDYVFVWDGELSFIEHCCVQ